MAVAPLRTRHLEVAVIGDVHLGTKKARATELLEYLDSITPDILIIAGDLVDLDNVSSRSLSPDHLDIVRLILDLAHAGTRVYYITGNHESRLRKLGDLALGNFYVREQAILHIAGHRYYIFHGDRLNAAVKYKLADARFEGLTLRVLRATDKLLGNAQRALGARRWSLARELAADHKDVTAYLNAYERIAMRMALSKGCDRVICGHVHAPKVDGQLVNDTFVQYLNCGDWVTNLTALEFRFGRWTIYKHDTADFPQPNKRLRVKPDRPSPRGSQTQEDVLRRILEAGPTEHS